MVTYMLLLTMEIKINEYLDENGKSPFGKWFDKLDNLAAAKITTAIYRMRAGNLSNVKRIGTIFEYKMMFGPGYRIYFGKDGDEIIILLGGGTKKSQSSDIAKAKECWKNYLKRKGKEICH